MKDEPVPSTLSLILRENNDLIDFDLTCIFAIVNNRQSDHQSDN